MKLKGAEKFINRLKAMTRPEQANRVAAALYQVGQKIELTAEKFITSGAVSGANHVPSAPGEPPNADTHHLDTNIETKIIPTWRYPKVTVESLAEYSAALEFGTEKMEARPFMRPAFDLHKHEVVHLVGLSIKVKQ